MYPYKICRETDVQELLLLTTTQTINRVISGKNLTFEEAYHTFLDIFTHDHDGYHFTAFITALHTKGETADELLGLIETTRKLGVSLRPNVPESKFTDLSGTGASSIKTINVSTAASFIVAAAGYVVAKQAGFAQTSPTGSADIFAMLGIDVFALTRAQVERALETVGICPFFISAMSPKLKNRSGLARKVFVDSGLGIESPFHLATFAYSPTPLKRRIYGCYSEKFLDVLGELFIKLGNERTLILHGVGGIPEASVVGKTIVVEQHGKQCTLYELTPADFGVPTYPIDEIRTGGKEQNMIEFFRILYGKTGRDLDAKRDMVLVNASASLFAMGRVKDFKGGTVLAREILEKGLAAEKLEEMVRELGNTDDLVRIKEVAHIR